MCAGRIRHVIVEVERRQLPEWLSVGDYTEDAEFRERFRAWLGALWSAKDARLHAVLGAAATDGI